MKHSSFYSVIIFLYIYIVSYSIDANAQLFKRIKESYKNKEHVGITVGVGGLNSIYTDLNIYYSKYKILFTRIKSIGMEYRFYPATAIALKSGYHVNFLAYMQAGAQTGIYTDFIHLSPFFRPEVGYIYKKNLIFRIGYNAFLPASNSLTENMNKFEGSLIFKLPLFRLKNKK